MDYVMVKWIGVRNVFAVEFVVDLACEIRVRM